MTEQTPDQQEIPIFRMQKMYIKDFSFESPNAPKVFLAKNQNPKVDFNLQLKNAKLDDDHSEVSIAITAKILDKNNDDSVMFIVEIEHGTITSASNGFEPDANGAAKSSSAKLFFTCSAKWCSVKPVSSFKT